MAKTEEYGVRLTARDETKKAVKSARGSMASLAKSYAVMGAGALAAYKIAQKGVRFLVDATKAAAQQQLAQNQLAAALKNTNQYSEEAVDRLSAYASELQGLTTTGDEVTIANMALAASFNIPIDKLEETAAALAGAEAAGIPAQTMLRGLAASLTGTAGTLSRYVPAVRELTEEQLRAGDAISMVKDQFFALAEAERMTFTGSVKALSNAWGDYKESVGSVIADSPAVRAAILELSDSLLMQADSARDSAETTQSAMTGVVLGVIDAAQFIAQSWERIKQVFEGGSVALLYMQDKWLTVFLGLQHGAEMMAIGIATALESIAPNKYAGLVESTRQAIEDTTSTIEVMQRETKDALDSAVSSWQAHGDKVQEIAEEYGDFRQRVIDTTAKIAAAEKPVGVLIDKLGDLGDAGEKAGKGLKAVGDALKIQEAEAQLESLAAQREIVQELIKDDTARAAAIGRINEQIRAQAEALGILTGEVINADQELGTYIQTIDSAEAQNRTFIDALSEQASAWDNLGGTVGDIVMDSMVSSVQSGFGAIGDLIGAQIDQLDGMSDGWKGFLKGLVGVLTDIAAAVIAAALAEGIANSIATAAAGAKGEQDWRMALVVFGLVAGTMIAGVVAAIASAESAKSDITGATGGLFAGGIPGKDSIGATVMQGELLMPTNVADAFLNLMDMADTVGRPMLQPLMSGSPPAAQPAMGAPGGDGGRGMVVEQYNSYSTFVPENNADWERKYITSTYLLERKMRALRRIV